MRNGCAMMLAFALLARGQQSGTEDSVRKILAARVDADKRAVGIVVGMVEPAGKRVIAYGRRAAGDGHALDGDTVFEIGSITKAFTGMLLADMARRGEVGLDDAAQKYLPEGKTMPKRGDRAITLRDLATHRSGLPRLPANLKPADKDNPYADYGAEQLYAFLGEHALRRDAGAAYEYSNLGAGLLGGWAT